MSHADGHRRLAFLVVLALIAGGLWAAGTAWAGPGTITGTISSSGGAVSGASVTAMPSTPSMTPPPPIYTTSGNSGGFVLSAEAGTYTVSVSQWGSDLIRKEIRDVTVVADEATPLGTITLQTGRGIAGVVKRAQGGAGVPNVSVNAFRSPYTNEGGYGNAMTANSGTVGSFRIPGLVPGSYTVQVSPSPSDNLVASPLTNVQVTDAGDTTVQEIEVVTGGQITGRVMGPDGPIAGMCVNAMMPGFFGGGSGAYGFSTTTPADGTFTISGLRAGEFNLSTYACSMGPQRPNFVGGRLDGVSVTQGSTTAVGDLTMAAGARVDGRINASATGASASSVCVSAMPATPPQGMTMSDGMYGWGNTDSQGNFEILGLRAGSFRLRVDPSCNRELDLVSATSDAFTLAAGGSNTVNLSLGPGGSMAGVVKDAAGTALGDICVWTNSQSLDPNEAAWGWANTNQSGSFAIRGLRSGQYTAYISPCWNSSANLVGQTISNVSVTAGAGTTLPEVRLAEGSTVSGRVLEVSGPDGVAGVCVFATKGTWDMTGGSWGYAQTNTNGDFTIRGLGTGAFTIGFHMCGASDPNAGPAGATVQPVSVTIGAQGDDVTIPSNPVRVVPAAGIQGTVTLAGGGGASGVCVSAERDDGAGFGWAYTDASGAFSMTSLAAGDYDLLFMDCTPGRGLADEWYDNQPAREMATAVTATGGAFTTLGAVSMAQAGSLAGTVTRSDNGEAASGVCVNAFSYGSDPAQPGTPVASTVTADDGTYELDGLFPGQYRVGMIPCGTDVEVYDERWLTGQSSATTADAITVTSGGNQTGVNAVMPVRASGAAVSHALAGARIALNPLAGNCTRLLFNNGDCDDPLPYTSPAISPQQSGAVSVSAPAAPVKVTVNKPSMLSDSSTITIDAQNARRSGAPSPPTSGGKPLTALTSYADVTLRQNGRLDSGGGWKDGDGQPATLTITMDLPASARNIADKDVKAFFRQQTGDWVSIPYIGGRETKTLESAETDGYYLETTATARQVVIITKHLTSFAAFQAPASSSSPGSGTPAADAGGPGAGSAGSKSHSGGAAAKATEACGSLKAAQKAKCLAQQRMKAAIAACGKKKGKAARAACVRKAKARGLVEIKKASCQALPVKKRAACIAAAGKGAAAGRGGR